MIKITAQELQDLACFISEISGVSIGNDKGYLLENRLQDLLASAGCGSFADFLAIARLERSQELRTQLIDAIVTNETYFFRDKVPFELLRYRVVPDIIDRKRQIQPRGPWSIRVWSAGCSTGQEVYSIAMALNETVGGCEDLTVHVLGTDISNKAITWASSGRYTGLELERGLPKEYLHKYFVQRDRGWQIRDEIRTLVSFRRMNLLQPFYGIGPFDIIFCRNVAIYFTEQNRTDLFKKMGRALNSYGALFIGGSESLSGVAPAFAARHYMKGIYYQKKEFTALSARQAVRPGTVKAMLPAPVVAAAALPSSPVRPGSGRAVTQPVGAATSRPWPRKKVAPPRRQRQHTEAREPDKETARPPADETRPRLAQTPEEIRALRPVADTGAAGRDDGKEALEGESLLQVIKRQGVRQTTMMTGILGKSVASGTSLLEKLRRENEEADEES